VGKKVKAIFKVSKFNQGNMKKTDDDVNSEYRKAATLQMKLDSFNKLIDMGLPVQTALKIARITEFTEEEIKTKTAKKPRSPTKIIGMGRRP
jgi:hypothetical protein